MRDAAQHFLDLLISMTDKEFRVRYKYTVLGFLWLILLPVFQMLVIGFIFTFFIRQPVAHYNFHLFIGLLVWNFFSLSLNKATPSIVYERSLIKKAKFPHTVIPLSIVLSNFINFLLALGLYLLAVLPLGTFSIEKVPIVVIGLLQLFTFTTGLSLLTSTLQFLQHAFLGEPLPGLAMIGSNLLVIFMTTILGIIVFNHESRNFDDWL